MKDYNNIPFKNHAIDRLSSQTTPPPVPGARSYSVNKGKPSIRMKSQPTGLEHEPKVRKRHMRP